MKKSLLGLILVLGLTGSAFGLDKAELDERLRTLTGRFEELQLKPDKKVPAETLRKAQGIVLLDRTKAGFLFAFQGGSGVALVRDTKGETWSPAAFLKANEASLGFQVGGEQVFCVMLMMSTNATRLLTEPDFEFGGEARGTAGGASSGVKGTVAPEDRPFLIYDDRQGLYGGVAIKGGSIAPDDEANRIYYGQSLSLKDILFDKKVTASETMKKLAAKLDSLAKPVRK